MSLRMIGFDAGQTLSAVSRETLSRGTGQQVREALVWIRILPTYPLPNHQPLGDSFEFPTDRPLIGAAQASLRTAQLSCADSSCQAGTCTINSSGELAADHHHFNRRESLSMIVTAKRPGRRGMVSAARLKGLLWAAREV